MSNLLTRRRTFSTVAYGILSGILPLSFLSKAGALKWLIREGKCEQASTPTPTNPVDIYCNNGALKYGQYGKNLFTTTGATLDKYIDTSGVEQNGIYNSYKFAHTALLPCQPNTKYTFSATNVHYANRSNHRIMGWASDRSFIQQEANLEIPAQTTVGTRMSVTFTTGASTYFLTINYIYDPDGELPQLELGESSTTYEPYHFGIHSEGTPEILAVNGKNRLNPDAFYFNASPPAWQNMNTWMYFPAGIYTIHTKYTGDNLRFRFYMRCTDLNGVPYPTRPLKGDGSMSVYNATTGVCGDGTNQTSAATLNSKKFEFTQPVLAQFALSNFLDSEDNFSEFQIEMGDSFTSYVPYSPQQIASVQDLLAVGTYKDTQDLVSGLVTRKVGILVFDGTEDWRNNRYATGNDVFSPDIAVTNSGPLMCTHYVESSHSWNTMSDGECSARGIANQIYFKDSRFTDTTTFKAFLAQQYAAGTPVIVLYPKSSESTESVTPQPLNSYNGTTVVSNTANVAQTQGEVKYKK